MNEFVNEIRPFLYGRPVRLIEIGAGTGNVYLALRDAGFPLSDAHLIEPNAEHRRLLEERIQAEEPVADHRVFLHGFVAGADDRTAAARSEDPSVAKAEQHETGGISDPAGDGSGETQRLDTFAQRIATKSISLLSIGETSYPVDVLAGSRDLLADEAIDIVYVEAALSQDDAKRSYYREIEDLLLGHGYKVFRFFAQHGETSAVTPFLERTRIAFFSDRFARTNPSELSRRLIAAEERVSTLETERAESLAAAQREREEMLESVREREERLNARIREYERLLDEELSRFQLTIETLQRQNFDAREELRKSRQARSEPAPAPKKIDDGRKHIAALISYSSALDRQYRAVLGSTSWRMTRPFRYAVRATRARLGRPTKRNTLPPRPEIMKSDAGPAGAAEKPKRETGLLTRPKNDPFATMRANVPSNIERLQTDYAEKGLDREPDTFVLYRIIGNDLVPRHKKGQSRSNVRFILENEPELAACEKRWIVNRIIDPHEERQIIALLEEFGQTYLTISFDPEEYRATGWDDGAFDGGFFEGRAFSNLGPEQKDRARTARYRLKNLYVMNNNGARNRALEDGIERAKWVLPFDGNCFLTESAWADIVSAVRARPYIPYFAVPMERMMNNSDLLKGDFSPRPVEEPQLLFRRDAKERFNENFPYGRRPKVELFWRLGIPGSWDRWQDDPWDQKQRETSEEAGNFGVAGWVARMFSGAAHLEKEDGASFKNRGLARQDAIIAAIDLVDRRMATAATRTNDLVYYDQTMLERVRDDRRERRETAEAEIARRIIELADVELGVQPRSVMDKTTLAPSGERCDYWHPAPYWWPNPKTSDGLPYVKKDGQRVPGTMMYEPDSARYDRTSLQMMFDGTLSLALAWFLTDDRAYAEKAASFVRAWFVSPDTAMTPHLTYSQVRMGRNNNEGFGTGIIEFKDLYYFLDAVRLLEKAGTFVEQDLEAFSDWLRSYKEWLENSAQGQKEATADNNHGTYYDLQIASIQSYLGEIVDVEQTIDRAGRRVEKQITIDGRQPEEMTRSITQHYCFYNLQGWLNLALVAKGTGIPFAVNGSKPKERLEAALRWIAGQPLEAWPFEQIDPFDTDRLLPLVAAASAVGIEMPEAVSGRVFSASRTIFDPHDGIAPFWSLAAAPAGNEGASCVHEPSSPPVVDRSFAV